MSQYLHEHLEIKEIQDIYLTIESNLLARLSSQIVIGNYYEPKLEQEWMEQETKFICKYISCNYDDLASVEEIILPKARVTRRGLNLVVELFDWLDGLCILYSKTNRIELIKCMRYVLECISHLFQLSISRNIVLTALNIAYHPLHRPIYRQNKNSKGADKFKELFGLIYKYTQFNFEKSKQSRKLRRAAS